jgi:hypothetical protein
MSGVTSGFFGAAGLAAATLGLGTVFFFAGAFVAAGFITAASIGVAAAVGVAGGVTPAGATAAEVPAVIAPAAGVAAVGALITAGEVPVETVGDFAMDFEVFLAAGEFAVEEAAFFGLVAVGGFGAEALFSDDGLDSGVRRLAMRHPPRTA